MNFALNITNTISYSDFKSQFAYRGDAIYSLVFQQNQAAIGLSREKFAVKNLRCIFEATFRLASKIGFQAMTLRDLSKETGLSMGGIYSTIGSKENIAIMVKNIVVDANQAVISAAQVEDDPKKALEILIKGDVYGSTLLQPWFYFLYFETRSLPGSHQEDSKNIELSQVAELMRLIDLLWDDSDKALAAKFVATTTLALVQEHYLKPWKYEYSDKAVDAYAQSCLDLLLCWSANGSHS